MTDYFELGFGKTDQEVVLDTLPVKGKMPSWLEGTLVRNGPGTFHVGEQRYRHWFDGLAMLHRFSFGGGQVSYANKFLQCNAYREAQETGRISYSEFATDPCRSMFGRVQSVFSPKITDSAKVSVTQVAERFLALAETPIQVEFDPETLKSVGVFNYEERLVGQMTTVHPHFDQSTMYNLVTHYHALSHYRFYGVDDGVTPYLVGEVPVMRPAYMHSFGMTENYFVLSEFPLVVDPLHLLLWLKPYIENFKWKPERGAPFTIIDRRTGEYVARVEADPYFAFHHINAFEVGDEIVLDIAAYENADVINSYYLNRLEDTRAEIPFGNLRRYRIPVRDGARATYEIVSDECIELPHIDYARWHMREDYRYVYAVGINPAQRQSFYNQIVKIDIRTGDSVIWREPGTYPGEPVFVRKPGAQAEDDGVLLSIVLDEVKGASFLLVLDAQTFEEQGRAELPHPVLFGYHGAYFEDV